MQIAHTWLSSPALLRFSSLWKSSSLASQNLWLVASCVYPSTENPGGGKKKSLTEILSTIGQFLQPYAAASLLPQDKVPRANPS